jgi:hypothetical protein
VFVYTTFNTYTKVSQNQQTVDLIALWNYSYT